jgi:hypothetical protein
MFAAGFSLLALTSAHNVSVKIGVSGGILLLVLALIETVRRLAFPRSLELGPDSLLLPHISYEYKLREYRIPYADIRRMWEVAKGNGSVLMLQTSERTVAVSSLLLPNMSSYIAVRGFIKFQVTPTEPKPLPPAEAGKYILHCNYDGSGEIYVSSGEIRWRVKADFSGRPHHPYRRFQLPDFVVYDWTDREIYRFKVVRKLVLAHFVMVENGLPVCTIRQRSLFLNKYTLDFANGQQWIFRLPLFSVMFGGLSATGAKIRVRLLTHNVWHVWMDEMADNPPLVAALAFIHRECLRCN